MRLSVKIVLFLALTLLPTFAGASSLTINNWSFENPPQNVNQFTTGSITGWTQVGGSNQWGVWRPVGASYFSSVPDGLQVAWTHSAGLSQTLADTVQPSTIYTLKVAVGDWDRSLYSHGYNITLKAGDTVLASLSGDTYAIPQHEFVDKELSYTSTSSDPNIGKALTIVLSSDRVETNWDLVRLDATSAVPIPPSLFLLGSGLAGVVGFRVRRKRS
jgi:hypothetical protein